jgi:hypothetical protein
MKYKISKIMYGGERRTHSRLGSFGFVLEPFSSHFTTDW